MKIKWKKLFTHLFLMFFVLIGSNVFVDAVAGDDVFRIFKMEPWKYLVIFLIGLVGALAIYWLSESSPPPKM